MVKVMLKARIPIIGHSMTIIGLEFHNNGSKNILVFDPSFSPSPGIKKLIDAKHISSKLDIKPLMKLHRRGEPYLAKYTEFEILTYVCCSPPPTLQFISI